MTYTWPFSNLFFRILRGNKWGTVKKKTKKKKEQEMDRIIIVVYGLKQLRSFPNDNKTFGAQQRNMDGH